MRSVCCIYGKGFDKRIKDALHKELNQNGYRVEWTDLSSINQEFFSEIMKRCEKIIIFHKEMKKDNDSDYEQYIFCAAEHCGTILSMVKNTSENISLWKQQQISLQRRQDFCLWDDEGDLVAKVIDHLQTINQSPVQRRIEFERLVADIFVYQGWKLKEKAFLHELHEWDLILQKDKINFCIEVKSYRRKYIEIGVLKNILRNLEQRNTIESSDKRILVLSNLIKPEYFETIVSRYVQNVQIIDYANLLWMTRKNEQLKIKLMNYVDYAVDDIEEKQLDIILPQRNTIEPDKKIQTDAEKYSDIFTKWDTEQGFTAYENNCTEALKILFQKDLTLWNEQKKSNADLYRFDLICKIRDEQTSPFWNFIQTFFNTKYIIFEFKNYSEQITQSEVYTTEKYLYAKALRSVAILISCQGTNENANKAIRGILRESGKLIISISNLDMMNMLQSKIENEDPADYLYALVDKLLIELEK